ncbi:MAG: hypothetical protein IT376_09995 [Polyangiaceae bacterium]|nr:hypothetical protein [Polyangiaceae bacterium]
MSHEPDEPESDDPSEPGEEVDPLLPRLPEELGIDPLFAALLHCAAFLDLGGDDHVAHDFALEVLEQLSEYVNRLTLTPERAAELTAQAERIAAYAEDSGWEEGQVALVRRFFYNCGLFTMGGDEDDDELEE